MSEHVGDVDEEPVELSVPERIGHYAVSGAFRSGDDVVFFLDEDFFDSSVGGFAYLPEGPDIGKSYLPNGFRLNFESLNGDWYTFTGGS